MNKKLLISICLFVATCFTPVAVFAEDVTCVTQYGGAVVCGAANPPFHAPVKTGIADFNLSIIGFCFVTVAGFLYFKSKKVAH